ncbi:MAG TPA: SAM-dependent methyltransferase [Nitrosospira sp.]
MTGNVRNVRKGQLVVVGTGLRTVGHLTTEAIAWIQAADKVLYVVGDPVAEEVIHKLNAAGAESLQVLYGEGKDRMDTYNQMVERILECVRSGMRVCGVFYGHPGVFVYPSHEAVRKACAEGFSAVMLPGISAEDCLFADLGIDPAASGCQSYEATDFLFNIRRTDPSSSLVLWQIGILGNATFSASGHYDTSIMPLLIAKLTRLYRPDHEVVVYEAAVHIGCPPRITRVPLMYLAQVEMSAATTLYIPPGMAALPDPHTAALAETQQRHGRQHAQTPQYSATASPAQVPTEVSYDK